MFVAVVLFVGTASPKKQAAQCAIKVEGVCQRAPTTEANQG